MVDGSSSFLSFNEVRHRNTSAVAEDYFQA